MPLLRRLQQRGNRKDNISVPACNLLTKNITTQSSAKVLDGLSAAVVITCYNHWSYTKQAIESVRQSTAATDCHIVVVNDNSSDDTAQQLQSELLQNDNFHIINIAENMGVTAAWNAGVDFVIRHLKTTVLFLTNNDVIFARDSLSRMMRQLKRNSDISIVGPLTNAPGHQPSQQVQYHLPTYQPSDLLGAIEFTSQKLTDNALQTVPWINGFCMGFRTAFLEDSIYFSQSNRTLYFNPAIKDYGNEDDYQRHHADGLIAVATDAFVFHYKDITLNNDASEWTNVFRTSSK